MANTNSINKFTRRNVLKYAPVAVVPLLPGATAQEFVKLAPMLEVFEAHFEANKINKLPLRELLQGLT